MAAHDRQDSPLPPRRWLRRGLWGSLALTLLFGLFIGWAVLFCFAEPPELDYEPVARTFAPRTGLSGNVSRASGAKDPAIAVHPARTNNNSSSIPERITREAKIKAYDAPL